VIKEIAVVKKNMDVKYKTWSLNSKEKQSYFEDVWRKGQTFLRSLYRLPKWQNVKMPNE